MSFLPHRTVNRKCLCAHAGIKKCRPCPKQNQVVAEQKDNVTALLQKGSKGNPQQKLKMLKFTSFLDCLLSEKWVCSWRHVWRNRWSADFSLAFCVPYFFHRLCLNQTLHRLHHRFLQTYGHSLCFPGKRTKETPSSRFLARLQTVELNSDHRSPWLLATMPIKTIGK